MAKFEDLKRAAQGAAYTATEKAQVVAAAAGEKAGAVRDVAKTNISLVTEKRNLEKAYQALGEWFAAQCGCDDVPEGAADMLAEIRTLEDKLETLRNTKIEQDMSARELLDRGREFFSEKAGALVSFARKPLEKKEAAAKAVSETAEAVSEKVEETVEAAAEAAEETAGKVAETIGETAEAAKEAAEEVAEKVADAVEETIEAAEKPAEDGKEEE